MLVINMDQRHNSDSHFKSSSIQPISPPTPFTYRLVTDYGTLLTNKPEILANTIREVCGYIWIFKEFLGSEIQESTKDIFSCYSDGDFEDVEFIVPINTKDIEDEDIEDNILKKIKALPKGIALNPVYYDPDGLYWQTTDDPDIEDPHSLEVEHLLL